MSDQDIDKLEEQFPAMAGTAFRAARKEALDVGLSVVESKGDAIYETFPDGTQKLIKKIAPRVNIKPGTIYKLR